MLCEAAKIEKVSSPAASATASRSSTKVSTALIVRNTQAGPKSAAIAPSTQPAARQTGRAWLRARGESQPSKNAR